MKKKDQILDTLFTLAIDHEKCARAKVVAAVAYKGKIVSFGFNQRKTHPFQARYGKNPYACYLHAEVEAIKNAKRTMDDLENTTLYIVRSKEIGGENVYGFAKPCIGCQSCIDDHKIRNIVYTTDNHNETVTVRRNRGSSR